MGFTILITGDTSGIFQRINDKSIIFCGIHHTLYTIITQFNNNKQSGSRWVCLKSILGDLWRPLYYFKAKSIHL